MGGGLGGIGRARKWLVSSRGVYWDWLVEGWGLEAVCGVNGLVGGGGMVSAGMGGLGELVIAG